MVIFLFHITLIFFDVHDRYFEFSLFEFIYIVYMVFQKRNDFELNEEHPILRSYGQIMVLFKLTFIYNDFIHLHVCFVFCI